MQGIASVAVFTVERLDSCLKALKLYEDGPADFSDYLILQIARQEGCDSVLTFDRKALKSGGFRGG